MTTIKLTEKQRDDLKSLLEDHQQVTDALDQVKKLSWTRVLTIANSESNEFHEVSLNYNFAKAVLIQQKQWIEAELKKLGVSV